MLTAADLADGGDQGDWGDRGDQGDHYDWAHGVPAEMDKFSE